MIPSTNPMPGFTLAPTTIRESSDKEWKRPRVRIRASSRCPPPIDLPKILVVHTILLRQPIHVALAEHNGLGVLDEGSPFRGPVSKPSARIFEPLAKYYSGKRGYYLRFPCWTLKEQMSNLCKIYDMIQLNSRNHCCLKRVLFACCLKKTPVDTSSPPIPQSAAGRKSPSGSGHSPQ